MSASASSAIASTASARTYARRSAAASSIGVSPSGSIVVLISASIRQVNWRGLFCWFETQAFRFEFFWPDLGALRFGLHEHTFMLDATREQQRIHLSIGGWPT